MKQGLTQWSTTLAKGMGVSALAMAMAAVSYTHLTLPTNREV